MGRPVAEQTFRANIVDRRVEVEVIEPVGDPSFLFSATCGEWEQLCSAVRRAAQVSDAHAYSNRPSRRNEAPEPDFRKRARYRRR